MTDYGLVSHSTYKKLNLETSLSRHRTAPVTTTRVNQAQYQKLQSNLTGWAVNAGRLQHMVVLESALTASQLTLQFLALCLVDDCLVDDATHLQVGP